MKTFIRHNSKILNDNSFGFYFFRIKLKIKIRENPASKDIDFKKK